MERDVLMGSAAVAFVVCLSFLLPAAGCGKKEGSASPSIPVSAPGIPQRASAEQPPVLSPDLGSDEVVVDPMIPSRAAPPGVSVKSVPGEVKKVLAVRWFVNGTEVDTVLRLPASRFGRGDRIHAVVTLEKDGVEKLVTTREAVAGNSLPVATSVRVEPGNPVAGGTVRAIVNASDPDDDPLKVRFQWYIDDVPVPGDTDTLVLNGARRDSWIHAKAVPNDGFADGGWGESPRYQLVNALPVVKSDVPREIPPGRNFVYRIEAEDPDGDPLTFTLRKGPAGAVLNGSTLEWPVPEDRFGRPVEFTVEISDGKDGRTVQNISMTVQPPRKP